MDPSMKHSGRLVPTDDRRGATNWGPYRMQLENCLAGIEKGNIRLLHVLHNKRTGVQVAEPPATAAEWIAQAPDGAQRTEAQYKAAVDTFDTWDIANRVTHAFIQSTLPEELHEDCYQRPIAHELSSWPIWRSASQLLPSPPQLLSSASYSI